MDNLKSAAIPVSSRGKQYHIDVAPGEIAPIVLLPGDPGRADYISGRWDKRQLIANHREYRTYTGIYRGTPISVTSTGIGSPSTAIAIEELLRVGARAMIRVGTCGAIQRNIRPGDLVVATGAVRLEGTSKQYAPVEYPAVADYRVVEALVETVETLGYRYHTGIVASTDSFYLGQGRPGFKEFITEEAASIIPRLQSLRVKAFEMEASLLFTLSSIYGFPAGCVCAAVANRVTDEFVVDAGVEYAIDAANEASRRIYKIIA
ncbi:MAG: uridine phosphorylase [Desulfurococcales archaeon]|nr:uridine phosphorylase [Desulfurococcales archaeon]